MVLDKKTIAMASGPNYAAFTTLFKNGSPQTHMTVSYTHLTLPTICSV